MNRCSSSFIKKIFNSNILYVIYVVLHAVSLATRFIISLNDCLPVRDHLHSHRFLSAFDPLHWSRSRIPLRVGGAVLQDAHKYAQLLARASLTISYVFQSALYLTV